MSVVARIKRAAGHLYYVDGEGRVMGGAKLAAAKHTGTTIKRKARHIYYIDRSGDVHEKKGKGA